MNCEICEERFSRLSEVIEHGFGKRHKYSHFFCISCGQPFYSVTDVLGHIESVEHSVMALATGIHFSTDDTDLDTSGVSFPPHTCCLICGYRGFLPIEEHIQSEKHGFLTFVMGKIMEDKKIRFSDKYTTQMLISKIINLKQKELNAKVLKVIHGPLPFICEMCNVHFSEPVYYTQHLENQFHLRTEQFINKLFDILKGVDIIKVKSHTIASKTFSNSLAALYFCEKCCLWVDSSYKYTQHKKSNRHKSVENLATSKKIGEVAVLRNSDPKKRKLSVISEGGKCAQYSDKYKEKPSKSLKISSLPLNAIEKEGNDEKNKERFTGNDLSVEAGETKSSSSLDVYDTVDSDSSDESEVYDISNPEEHYCEICDFLTYSSLHFGGHFVSRHHKRMKKIWYKKQEKDSDSPRLGESA